MCLVEQDTRMAMCFADKGDGLEPLISPADGNAQILSDAINTTVI